MTGVTIPDSVTTIGDGAFSSCSRLTSVTVPNSVTAIGECAFQSSDLTIYGYENSYAERYAAEAGIPFGTVFTIENGVLTKYNGSDEEVAIPNSVTEIGDSAFSGCSSLTIYGYQNSPAERSAMEANIHFVPFFTVKDGVLLRYIGEDHDLTIPNGVITIGYNAFSNDSKLTSITIPNSVAVIEDYAFSGCSGLTHVTLGAGLKSMGVNVFSGCINLTDVTVPRGVKIDEGAFAGTPWQQQQQAQHTTILPIVIVVVAVAVVVVVVTWKRKT